MSSKKIIWITVIVILAAAVGFRIYGNFTKTTTNSPKGSKSAAAIEAKKASVGPISANINTTGTIQGIQEANIASKVAGRVNIVNVTDGTYVKAGQTLVELDSSEIQAQISQAYANRNQAIANRDNAKMNAARLQNLFQEDAIAKQQLDNAQTQYYVYDAQVAQTNAAINLYQAQLANTIITAPFDGYVANKRVVQGDMASPNITLMTLIDMSKVKVEMTVGESEIAHIKIGQKVRVAVDAYPGANFEGIITEISPAADLKNRTFKAWVQIDNPNHTLRSGMFARVTIPYNQVAQAVKVPKDALVIRDNKPYVFVVNDDTVKLTPVMPGLEDENEIEILSGLAPDTLVSIWGHESLQDNDKIMIGKRGGKK